MTPRDELRVRDAARLRHLPKNLLDAYVWYARAAQSGVDEAASEAKTLKQHLSADQLRRAADALSISVPRQKAPGPEEC